MHGHSLIHQLIRSFAVVSVPVRIHLRIATLVGAEFLVTDTVNARIGMRIDTSERLILNQQRRLTDETEREPEGGTRTDKRSLSIP